MAKKPSKEQVKKASTTSLPSPKNESKNFKTAFSESKKRFQSRFLSKKSKTPLHRSFHRSYREDYDRPFEAPGLLSHAMASFKILFRNWRIFLPLILVATFFYIILVGLMSESTFVAFQNSLNETTEGFKNGEIGTFARSGLLLISTITTGGLSTGMSEAQQIFSVLLFIIIWLVVIYLLRHLLAGHRPKFRDGLYNALSPLISTLVVFAVIFVEAIPIMIVVITYSSAVKTNFLSTPFYALIYVIFAALLIILSVYLISSSLIALVAVSAPGLYPFVALRTASDLLAGRRIKFIGRLIYLVIVIAIIWVVIMTPLIALDLWLKSVFDWLTGIPIVSIELLIMTCFTTVYITTYLYLFYRRLLDYEN